MVTTAKKAGDDIAADACARAAAWGLPFVERRGNSIERVRGDADGVIVVGASGLALAGPEGTLRFHDGVAALRLRNIDNGFGDPLVRAAELGPGDRVLDTTFGLGRDALVAARLVGPTGAVHGLEVSWPLWLISSEGLAARPADPVLAPITVEHADSVEWLRDRGAGQRFDVVVIDPMFEEPKRSEVRFESVRVHASHQPLTPAWLALARSVATRWVVVKTDGAAPWFAEAGLEPVRSTGPAKWFRVAGAAD